MPASTDGTTRPADSLDIHFLIRISSRLLPRSPVCLMCSVAQLDDSVVPGVGDVDLSVGSESYIERRIEVSGAHLCAPGYEQHRSVAGHLHDPVLAGVGDP